MEPGLALGLAGSLAFGPSDFDSAVRSKGHRLAMYLAVALTVVLVLPPAQPLAGAPSRQKSISGWWRLGTSDE